MLDTGNFQTVVILFWTCKVVTPTKLYLLSEVKMQICGEKGKKKQIPADGKW